MEVRSAWAIGSITTHKRINLLKSLIRLQLFVCRSMRDLAIEGLVEANGWAALPGWECIGKMKGLDAAQS